MSDLERGDKVKKTSLGFNLYEQGDKFNILGKGGLNETIQRIDTSITDITKSQIPTEIIDKKIQDYIEKNNGTLVSKEDLEDAKALIQSNAKSISNNSTAIATIQQIVSNGISGGGGSGSGGSIDPTLLMNYHTKTEILLMLKEYIKKDDVTELLKDYYSKEEVDAKFSEINTRIETLETALQTALDRNKALEDELQTANDRNNTLTKELSESQMKAAQNERIATLYSDAIDDAVQETTDILG